jgi:hypothetical protein
MRYIVLAALALIGACRTPHLFRSAEPASEPDSLYWRGVQNLDPSNRSGTLDAGIAALDAYLATPGRLKHASEATALRSLARSAQQLAKLEAALQTKVAAADTKQRAEPEVRRDEDAVKEIQRLKEELAKANEELERIKKRLAAPKP